MNIEAIGVVSHFDDQKIYIVNGKQSIFATRPPPISGFHINFMRMYWGHKGGHERRLADLERIREEHTKSAILQAMEERLK